MLFMNGVARRAMRDIVCLYLAAWALSCASPYQPRAMGNRTLLLPPPRRWYLQYEWEMDGGTNYNRFSPRRVLLLGDGAEDEEDEVF